MTDQELMEEEARMSDAFARHPGDCNWPIESCICEENEMRAEIERLRARSDYSEKAHEKVLDEIERLREERDKLAEYVRLLWAKQCYEWGPEFQEIGNALEICELRPVEPGSPEEEEWGEEAELYYLAPWVIGGEDV